MMIPADDRGLAYGDGVFETVRLASTSAPLRALHRQRLQHGFTRLGLTADIHDFDRHLDALLATPGAGVAKLVVTRGSGGRGYAAPVPSAPRWVVQRFSRTAPAPSLREQGLVLGIAEQRLTYQPALAGIKHLNRLEQVTARSAAQRAGWDEALMLDHLGRPHELTAMNLFARFGRCWWTPSLISAGVEGVARHWCLQQLAQAGERVRHTPLALTQLRDADEVFACNSVAGVLPVRKLAVWQWPVGNTTRTLQHAFEQLFV